MGIARHNGMRLAQRPAVPAAAAVPWGCVGVRAERVMIVASGPSQRALAPAAIAEASASGVHVIAINGALRWYNLAAASWFTLDPDRRTLPLMQAPRAGVVYYAAVPVDYGQSHARVAYHRVAPAAGVTYLRRVAGPGVLGSRTRLSEDPGAIHTGNSAWGALGVAYLMQPRLIAFLGLDGTREEYAYGAGRPFGNFDHLPALFASALPQLAAAGIQVLNGSPASRITCFPRATPEAALAWISST